MACVLSSFPDVGMNRLMVVKAKNGTEGLKTTGVAACFAISIQGRDKENTPILGLAHTTHACTPKWIFDQLIEAINKEGNVTVKPVFEVAGGLPNITEREQEKVMKLSKVYNIAKTTFNILKREEDPGLTMIITPNGVSLTQEEIEGEAEEAGIEFSDLYEEETESSDEIESGDEIEGSDESVDESTSSDEDSDTELSAAKKRKITYPLLGLFTVSKT